MTSPYLTIPEAAHYLRYTGKRPDKACREFLRRHQVPTFRRGKALLVLRASLDAAIKPTRKRKSA
jgi:hypothetical protein